MKNKTLLLMALLSVPLMANDVISPIQDYQIPAGDPYAVTQPAVESADLFRGKKVAILVSHGVEETEMVFPFTYLTDRGADVEILVPSWTPRGVSAVQFLKPTLFVKATATFAQGWNRHYDLVVILGGAWNAQVVRGDADALKLVRRQYDEGLPLAAICAGTSVLIDAGIAKGTRLTGSPTVKIDLINAGAEFVNEAAVWDRNLLTSRDPNDLPAFVQGLKTQLLQ